MDSPWTVRGAQKKARVWATCPETKWLMLVDIDIENGTVCINKIHDKNHENKLIKYDLISLI